MGWRRNQRAKNKGKGKRKTDYEIWKEIRKDTPPPGYVIEDESKYNRKKHRKDDENGY